MTPTSRNPRYCRVMQMPSSCVYVRVHTIFASGKYAGRRICTQVFHALMATFLCNISHRRLTRLAETRFPRRHGCGIGWDLPCGGHGNRATVREVGGAVCGSISSG